MKKSFFLFGIAIICILQVGRPANEPVNEKIPQLDNPMTVRYLKSNLRRQSPKLILTPAIEKNLRQRLKTDPVVQNVYKAIQLNAERIMKQPVLQWNKVGLRLQTSYEMHYRMSILGIIYLIDEEAAILKRINEEVVSVCSFNDWNPTHYLDVAEMSMAVAIALDWTKGRLPSSTIAAAKTAMIDKGIIPSYNEKGNTWWVRGVNNWNQVCHAGMIAASIMVADKDPELAAKTISRALEGMPLALVSYGPDGVYPEGATYWGYGTTFSVLTSSMFESAFGTDFGLADYPSFKESAQFMLLSLAPSGLYYNYGDCGDAPGEYGDFTLAWFAGKTGNMLCFEKEKFMLPPDKTGTLPRHAGAGLVWLSQIKPQNEIQPPQAWKGEGINPVFYFRGGENDSRKYYFGGKGGKANIPHGNMDAGSFVFELDGIRWSIDPGNQSYHELERTGFKLWSMCQDCERWTLLTKNNFGHSTLTVNNQYHQVNGMAKVIEFKEGNAPEATLDMTPVFEGLLKSAKRRFVKDGPVSLLVEDEIEASEHTRMIVWQMITQADVQIVEGGAMLSQNGKSLKLENLSHPGFEVSVVSLCPAPLKLDRQMEGLKRIEIRVPAWTLENGRGKIRVRLSGN